MNEIIIHCPNCGRKRILTKLELSGRNIQDIKLISFMCERPDSKYRCYKVYDYIPVNEIIGWKDFIVE